MRVTTLHGTRDIRLEDHPLPVIGAPSDAVIRVVAACICGSDLWPYRGESDIDPGQTIGHEMVGVVEEAGSEVVSFRAGDFVVVPFCHCDNTCPHCTYGMQSACVNSSMTTGGQGEYALVTQAEGTMIKTDGMPDEELIPSLLALSDVFATGWHCAVSANVRQGATVVVVGDGAVGLSGVLAAAELGAEQIFAMSRHPARQEVARQFGASEIVEERGKEGAARIKDLTDGVGADAVLECVGTKDAMLQAFGCARPGSTVGFVGVPHGAEAPVPRMFAKNIGLAGGVAPVRKYIPELLDLVVRRSIDPGLVFDTRMSLDDVAEGYRAMDERRAIKVLVEP